MNGSSLGRGGFAVRPVLSVMVFLAVLPTLAFAIIAILNYAKSERADAVHGLIESADGVARAIDMEFEIAVAALTALRSSTLLERGDLAAFEQRLNNTRLKKGKGFLILDENGQAILNASSLTAAEINSVRMLPPPAADGVSISNVLAIEPAHGPFVFVAVPVVRAGGARWRLGTYLDGGDFENVVRDPGVPDNWIVSIVDRQGTHMRRSHKNEQFAGRPLIPALVHHIADHRTGTLQTVSLEGIDLISTVAYTRTSGWAAAVGLPLAKLEAPLRESLWQLVVIGTLLVASALILAFLVAETLIRAFAALKTSAEALGRGAIVDAPAASIREANIVLQTMQEVSHRLAARTADLTDLNNSLEAQVAERTAELVDQMAIRERNESQLRQLYKQDAIGKLTGGIAHDFNNMLAVVMSGLNLARRRLERGDANVLEFIDGAMNGAENAAKLTQRLLAFSRQQPLRPEVVDANAMVRSTTDMLRRTLPENIEIELVLAGGLWRTFTDLVGLQNAVLNLAVNARDAMPDGGKLTIETGNTHLDDAYAKDHVEVTAGQYVMVALTDTGVGIPAEILSEVYEPFFTTKEPGRGTGLGLSQVQGFIKQSNGHIKIYSESGHGTTVKLYLPRYQGDAAPASSPSRNSSRVERAAGDHTILLVEDDADVRAATLAVLKELGYAAVEADSGDAALALLDSHPEITLLMTDVVMPGMNGRQLATEAAARRPGLRVLYTTGYTRNAIVHHGVLDPDVSMIGKPYTLEALSQKLSEILGPP